MAKVKQSKKKIVATRKKKKVTKAKKISPKKEKILKVVKSKAKKSVKKTKPIVKKKAKVVQRKKIVKKRKVKVRIKVKSTKDTKKGLQLERSVRNPIIKPRMYSWESQAVFNPAAILSGGRVHLFYRALGGDGISRIGYASSKDGINFDERLFYPVYSLARAEETKKHWPFTSPARPAYDTLYASGGGWGGCEDPRSVLIDGKLYLTMNIFNGWENMEVMFTSIKEDDLLKMNWNWERLKYLSHPGDRQKNWVLFPEKIDGKFVVFHNLDRGNPNEVFVTYHDELDWQNMPTRETGASDPQRLPDHIVAWHKRTRSAACPPIKTEDGWLLLYHAMDKDESRYKLGAMILDLKDPSKVIYRAERPILEPDEWYENDWKPGIIYASGAVVRNGKLFVYYGGGDKYVGVASILLSKLIKDIKTNTEVKLTKNKKIKVQ